MVSVLFVCLGNICRSPMAEAVFRHMVKEEGLEDRIRVDSAGTGDWHTGEPLTMVHAVFSNNTASPTKVFAPVR